MGLTGGIAAGKSVVTARLRELGIVVIDHDLLARAVVEPGTSGLAEISSAFGAGVLTASGELDRALLGAQVFGDRRARIVLNGIIHPRVAEAAAKQERTLVERGARIVVHDVPLLVETGRAEHFDEVIVVDTPAAVRVERLVETRGLSRPDALARLAAQASDGARSAVADHVLDGAGSCDGLRRQVDVLVAAWRGRGEAGTR